MEETVELVWMIDPIAASSRLITASSAPRLIMSSLGLLLVPSVTGFSCLWKAACVL